jgi:transposase
MREYDKLKDEGKSIFVGIDLHLKSWHVTIRTLDEELFSGGLPGRWESLRSLLERYRDCRLKVVYEAGYFGFWLYDRLIAWGAECVVTPPSLIPQQQGNRVKTDRRDSRRLADYLAKGLLKRVWVPTSSALAHRQVARRRRQLIRDRVRTQLRIKAELRYYGIEIVCTGKWSRTYVANLRRLKFSDRWLAESFGCLLDEYDFLEEQIKKQTVLLKELSQTPMYQESVSLLRSIGGIGLITAMEILLEIGDFGRFNRGEQLAAYVGLTPSQYSSGDKVRMGRITGIGKATLRGLLVEASWILIGKDPGMRAIYDRIKRHAGGKRAIVAIARRLLLCIRRMMIDRRVYISGQAV